MNINEKKQKLIEQFGAFDDWMDRYNLLIEKDLSPKDELAPD